MRQSPFLELRGQMVFMFDFQGHDWEGSMGASGWGGDGELFLYLDHDSLGVSVKIHWTANLTISVSFLHVG